MKKKGIQRKGLQLKKMKVVWLEEPNLIKGGKKPPITENTENNCNTGWPSSR